MHGKGAGKLSHTHSRLNFNRFGPLGGTALAEALKINTALQTLTSAALPQLRPHVALTWRPIGTAWT